MAQGENLVLNGAFDDPEDPLKGWQTRFDLPGESWYKDNHRRVSIVEREGPQKDVLALWGDEAILNAPGQGTKVESAPIPVSPGGRYRLTVKARSTGPDCRILVEGYKWKPGIRPHDTPRLYELRKCYRSQQVFFGTRQGGTSGGVGRSWQKASVTFPDPEASPAARELFDQVEFLVVHVVAIKGSEGYLYVDDVVLERLN